MLTTILRNGGRTIMGWNKNSPATVPNVNFETEQFRSINGCFVHLAEEGEKLEILQRDTGRRPRRRNPLRST